MLYGSIEAGGTKFVCAVGNEKLEIIKKESFPTTSPSETMGHVYNFFNEYSEDLVAIGIGSFGPIDVDVNSETYGYITNTPKIDWQYFDFLGSLKREYNIPIAWTTDVNASAFGELKQGAGLNKKSVAYFTIGTGIGGGVIQDDVIIEGFTHPEMGHLLVRRHPEDNFKGNCPFHGDCLEGMACGPAIEQRNGVEGQNIPEDSSFWDIEAYYIAQLVYNVTINFSPNVVILGGGVMDQPKLFKAVKDQFLNLLNNYRPIPAIDDYIVAPKLQNNAATIGCLAMAKRLVEKEVSIH